MLDFASGHSTQVNSAAAMQECIEQAVERRSADVNVLLVHSTIGHNFKALMAAARDRCPNAIVVGCTGAGVIYDKGVSEAMKALAVMAITGPEAAVAFRDGLDRSNGRELGRDAAAELDRRLGAVKALFLFTAGFDVTGDQVIAGVEDVFGRNVPVFGGIAADNGKARSSFQFCDGTVTEHGLILVGVADDSLDCEWVCHHGSNPVGTPFVVTEARLGHVTALDGKPAWEQVMSRLGLPASTPSGHTLPIAGMGLELSNAEQAEYHNSHLMLVPLETDGRGGFYFPASVKVGDKLWLMQRDEEKTFAGVDRITRLLGEKIDGRELVAVLHSDCMARGRLTFDQVLKDEIIARMQDPLLGKGPVPWLGVYAYSEFCPLGGRNQFHSYTTTLCALVRRRAAG
jgi:hypothetical protein